LVGAIIELVDQQTSDDDVVERLEILLKAVRYGLPNQTCISIHEIGFSDRVVALQVFEALGLNIEDKDLVKATLRANPNTSVNLVSNFPSYFVDKMNEIIDLQ